jgi:U3 small nucleolar RNA-associated protein 3
MNGKSWGASKKMYYNTDELDESDQDAAKEEEMEAMRIQRKRAEAIDEGDYIDEDFAKSFKQSGADLVDSDADEAEESVFDLEALKQQDLSDKEVSNIVNTIMPEIPVFIQEFNERKQFVAQVEPILEAVAQDPPESEQETRAIAFLTLKYRMYPTLSLFCLFLRTDADVLDKLGFLLFISSARTY